MPDPTDATAFYLRGNALIDQQRPAEALASFHQALVLKPDYLEPRYNAAVLLAEAKDFTGALAMLDPLAARWPGFARGQNLRGNVLVQLQRPAEALVCYDRAILADAAFADAWSNRATAHRDLGQFDAALADYRRAIAIRPKFAEAHWNISISHLLQGDFAAGWPGYEWRKAIGNAYARPLPAPAWDGIAPLAGKTIFLACEQGFGDTIQFARYAPPLVARGARVVLSAQRPLCRLLARALPAVTVIDEDDPPPRCDFALDLLSLPLAFGTDCTSIPAPLAIRADDAMRNDSWQRLLSDRRPRIGIAWSGNPAHISDHHRSIPLHRWHGLWHFGAQWIAVQKDLRPPDAAALAAGNIARFGDQLADFSDTAALIAATDLVIAVDTSVAHLAASMGKPVWLLVASTPDWRWLRHRRDSPWYPSLRLFRQPHPGAWAPVFDEIAQALSGLIGRR